MKKLIISTQEKTILCTIENKGSFTILTHSSAVDLYGNEIETNQLEIDELIKGKSSEIYELNDIGMEHIESMGNIDGLQSINEEMLNTTQKVNSCFMLISNMNNSVIHSGSQAEAMEMAGDFSFGFADVELCVSWIEG